MSKIFVGQSKLTIQLSLGQSLAGAESAVIKFIKPSQTRGEWLAEIINEATGLIQYEVENENTINEAGDWKMWAVVEFVDNQKAPSTPVTVKVWKEGQS